MIYGLSVLLGEIIAAEKIAHKDCEYFQIVCPSCAEPVFKVERPDGRRILHYLSHYKRDESYDDSCELRVNSMAKKQIDKTNAESREQRLKYFLEVFQDELIAFYFPISEANPRNHDKVRTAFRLVDRSKALWEYKKMHFQIVRAMYGAMTYSDFYDVAKDYVRDISEVGTSGIPKTTFSLATQIRIAHDMLSVLTTGMGERNLNFLFNHAFLWLQNRLVLASRQREMYDYEEEMGMAMMRILEVPKEQGREILRRLNGIIVYPPHVITQMPVLEKLGAEVSHEMVGALIGMPWFEILMHGHQKKNNEDNI